MATYRVLAPLVLVKDEVGAFGYFYAGAVLPPYVKGDTAKALLDEGLIGPADEPASATPAASDPAPVRTDQPGAPASEVDRPAQVAPKDAWVSYAVSRGAERGEAEGLTKAELLAKYGS